MSRDIVCSMTASSAQRMFRRSGHRFAAKNMRRLRASTLDRTTVNQERERREVTSRIGCEIVKVYKDHGISGTKGRDSSAPPSMRSSETPHSAGSRGDGLVGRSPRAQPTEAARIKEPGRGPLGSYESFLSFGADAVQPFTDSLVV
jgi:hypothetical protein